MLWSRTQILRVCQEKDLKKWSRRHPTGLHDDNFCWFNQVVFKEQITPPPPQNGYVVNAHTEMEKQAVNKIFQLDFSEQTDGKELGYSQEQEDKQFFNIVTQGILHTEYGHYEIPLPLCRDNVCFPENKEQVLQRAH